MIISSCRIFHYSLSLVSPLTLAGRMMREREGLLIRIGLDSGVSGWGDVAPLPGFSRESIEEAEMELITWVRRLRKVGFDPRGDDLESWLGYESTVLTLPSVRFGLEVAFVSLSRQTEGKATAELGFFEGGVPVNGLLAGPREQVLGDARRLRDEGYQAVKLKVGTRPVVKDVELTREVRTIIGDGVELRLDANRSWSLEQATEFGRDVEAIGVEYIEEPLHDPTLLRALFDATGIAVALDESLLELRPDGLEERPEVGAVVLKPTLLGGIAKAREWVTKALDLNVRPIISSCFESGVGLLALAALAWSSTGDAVPAGLDTYRWLGTDVVEPRIPFRSGTIEWTDAMAQSHKIDGSRLSGRRHG